MRKCNRCNKSIDCDKEAFVTIPNPEQYGYKSRRPTSFSHASCFERDIKRDYEQAQKERDALLLEIGRANANA